MPQCMGRPEGPCPDDRCDKTVKNSQGDLMLCAACEHYRFPHIAENLKKVTNKKTAYVLNQAGAEEKSAQVPPKSRSTVTRSSGSTSSASATAAVAAVTDTGSSPGLILNEVLAYTSFYRRRANIDALKRVALSTFLPCVISEAKKTLVTRFRAAIDPTSQILSERRSSTVRAAHEVEMDDIIGILDILDTQCAIDNVIFVAANFEIMPKFGPEEINIASVVERQSRVEFALNDVSASINELRSVGGWQSAAEVLTGNEAICSMIDDMQKRLDSFVTSIHARLEKISTVQTITADSVATAAASIRKSTTTTASPTQPAPVMDRSNNIIIFGIPENQDSVIWRRKVDDALEFIVDHPVDIMDVFRLGKFNQSKVRPVLVKLRVAWDRRLILSRCSRLKNFCTPRVYVAADEPPELRRKNTFERMKNKAERLNKTVSVVDENVLYIDNVAVFSLSEGLINSNNDVLQ